MFVKAATYTFILLCLCNFSFAQKDSIVQKIKSFTGEFNGGVAYVNEDTSGIFFSPMHGAYADSSTLFQSAALSQTVIAALIHHQVELGNIQLSDKVSQYLKDFPFEQLEIQHLLLHQSALITNYLKLFHRNFYNDPNNKLEGESYRIDNYDVYPLLIKHQKELKFKPGSQYEFNPVNYILLSVLLENLSFQALDVQIHNFFAAKGFSKAPMLVNHQDTFPYKNIGISYQNGYARVYDNLQHMNFPYLDGTYGHQHIYFTLPLLLEWGQYLQSKIKTDGFAMWALQKDAEVVYGMGQFCAHQSAMFIKGEEVLVYLSSANTKAASIKGLREHLFPKLKNKSK